MSSTALLKPALRVDATNANHHLWCNNGTWWIHYTLHRSDYTAQRVRKSLRTRDLRTARRKRDSILGNLLTEGSCS